MEKKSVCWIVFVILIFQSVLIIPAADFDTKSVLLKFTVKKDTSATKSIELSSETGGLVEISIKGIEKGVNLESNEVILEKSESKNVEIIFNGSELNEGIYVGYVNLKSGTTEKQIPIILEVESKDIFFDGNLEISTRYSEVSPGERIVAQLNIFDLFSGGGTQEGLGSSSVEVIYEVWNYEGQIIVSETESLVVDKKILETKSISLPKEIKEGQYVISATINYKSSVGTATEIFNVAKNSGVGNFEFNLENAGALSVFIFIGFIFLVLILFFAYIIYDRDKLVSELKDFNSNEFKMQKSLLKEQAKFAKKNKGKTPAEVNNEVNKKLKKVKEEQNKRMDEMKKLQKKGELDSMKRKINEWKKKGFNTMALEAKLSGLSNEEMKKILNEWKRNYKY